MAEGWTEFDAVIEPVPWGDGVYTLLRVPEALVAAVRAARTRRVEGRIETEQVNLAVNSAEGVGGSFLYCGKPLQRRLGLGHGEVVRCVLRPADPDEVPVPDDVRRALEETGRSAAWSRLTPAARRRLLVPVDGAVRADTRARRVAELVRGLAADRDDRDGRPT